MTVREHYMGYLTAVVTSNELVKTMYYAVYSIAVNWFVGSNFTGYWPESGDGGLF